MTTTTVRAWAAAMRADADHINPTGTRCPDIDRLTPEERGRYRRWAAGVLDAVADEIDTDGAVPA